MDLKVAFVIICLCASFITSTEGGIPKCCVTTQMKIPFRVLLKVQRWDVQQNSGACDIFALVLHVKDKKKPVCAHPRILSVLRKLQQRRKQIMQRATS